MLSLTKNAAEWINGELLGDGCLQSRSPRSAYFAYSSKYLEYIDYVSGTLNSFGIMQSGNVHKNYGGYSSKGTYCYASRFYSVLSPIKNKWYPEGRKVVPRDIKLTSLTCRQWYIGDGYLDTYPTQSPRIGLSTQGFCKYDVVWLIDQLSEIGILATRRSTNIVSIATCSVMDFLMYIGECPVKCYQYKWDV